MEYGCDESKRIFSIGAIETIKYWCPVHGRIGDTTISFSIKDKSVDCCMECLIDLIKNNLPEIREESSTDWLTDTVKEDERNAIHKESTTT